jgi:hypothetical protein
MVRFMSSTNFYEWLDQKLRKDSPKSVVPIILPILLILVLYLITSIMLMNITATSMQQQQMLIKGRAASIEIFRPIAFFIRLVAMLAHTVVVVVICLILSRRFLRKSTEYRTSFSMALYGEVCYALGWLLVAPLIIYKNDLSASLSLANVIIPGADPKSLLFVLLSRLTIFFFMEMVLIAEGVVYFSDSSRRKGYIFSTVAMVGSLFIMFLVFH